ncbi:MAG: radical SAM protein [Pseudomonadota bacterium]
MNKFILKLNNSLKYRRDKLIDFVYSTKLYQTIIKSFLLYINKSWTNKIDKYKHIDALFDMNISKIQSILFKWITSENIRYNNQEIINNSVYLSTLPHNVMFDTSSACNFDCNMCLRVTSPEIFKKMRALPSKRTMKEFIKILPFIKQGLLYRSGEPFLNKALLPLSKLSQKCQTEVTITTNGSLIDDKKASYIVKSQIKILRYSIDAASKETFEYIRKKGNFDEIMAGIDKINFYKRKFNSNYPELKWHFVAQKRNISELLDAVKLASVKGFEEFEIHYMVAPKSSPIESQCLYYFKSLSDEMMHKAKQKAKELNIKILLPNLFEAFTENKITAKKHAINCKLPWFSAVIRTTGDVVPCCGCAYGVNLGNLNEMSFRDIWNGEGFVQLRKNLVENNPPDYCLNCTGYKTFQGLE